MSDHPAEGNGKQMKPLLPIGKPCIEWTAEENQAVGAFWNAIKSDPTLSSYVIRMTQVQLLLEPDDLWQEFFLLLIAKWHLFKPPKGRISKAYWVTVVRRLLVNAYRKQSHERRLRSACDEEEAAAEQPCPWGEGRAEDSILVHETLAALSEDDRKIITLRHFEGMTHAEASLSLGISIGASRKRQSRAEQRFRNEVSKHTFPVEHKK